MRTSAEEPGPQDYNNSSTTCADLDRETVVSTLFGSVSKVNRDRDHWPSEGEKLAQQKFYEAEADVEIKHWEKNHSDMALHENRRADQAQR